jgi:hypothetical protein
VLRSVHSGPEAACALAGARAGLEYVRHKHHGGGSGGNHGGGSHGGGNHGGNSGGGQDCSPEDQQCKDDGRFAGQTAATAYCDLSISLDGLEPEDLLTPGPVSRCSKKFEEACRATFDQVAANYPETSGDPAADCTPFTSGDFQEAYENARFNQCLFSIGMPGGGDDPCANGACECSHQSHCDLDCPTGGCDQTCEHSCECRANSGDAGSSSCRHASLCNLEGGSDSALSCEHAAVCELAIGSGTVSCDHVDKCKVEVTEHADVTCKHAGKCEVHIQKGSVRCDHVGKCRVECADGGQAKCCGDGRYVCGQEC